jgi:hypothetical protein
MASSIQSQGSRNRTDPTHLEPFIAMNKKIRFTLCVLPLCMFSASFMANAMNNDGYVDLLWRNSVTRADRVWAMNPSATGATALPLAGAVDDDWKMVGTGDFNGDGQLDIVWYLPSNGHIAYWYMNGTSIIGSIDLINANPPMIQDNPNIWELVGVGYFGGPTDKKPDLLWHNKIDDTFAVWHMNDSTYIISAIIKDSNDNPVPATLPWRYATTGDYGNDHQTDIFFRNIWYGYNAFWNLNGTTWLGSVQVTPVSVQDWELVGANHFNPDTDSMLDLLWRNRVSGAVVVWMMNGVNYWYDTTVNPPETLDLNWRICATGDSRLDLDHDGLPDLWEINYFGNPNQQNGSGDPDLDGRNNLQEFQSGTDPTLFDFAGATDYNELVTDIIVPDTMGAIGPSHFVETLNNVVIFFNKATGTRVLPNGIAMADFFAVAPNHSGKADPRIIYDPDLGRWIAVALDSASIENVLVAISKGPDPIGDGTGDWMSTHWDNYWFHVGTGVYVDFTQLGVDRNGIYITFRNFNRTPANLIVAIPKTPSLRGGGAPDFQTPSIPNVNTVAIQPAINFDSAIPATEPALFIAQDFGAPSTTILVGRLTWSGSRPDASINPTWPSIGLLQPGADLYQYVPGGNPLWPLDPLSLDSNNWRLALQYRGSSDYAMAVIRNGFLWTCHAIGVNRNGLYTGTWPAYGDADRVACEWLKFQVVSDGSSKTLQPVDYARAFERGVPRSYFMPSLAVNWRGDVVMGFSGCSTFQYIGSYCVGRLANAPAWQQTDLAHSLDGPRLVKSGAGRFESDWWGDYSNTSVDPTDDLTFWTVQEHAETPVLVNGVWKPNWGTWICRVPPF